MKRCLIGILVLLSYCAAHSADNTLQLVHVVFRHGERAPKELYPNDPNSAYFWSGLGQLTNKGKHDQYELGRFLRQRYNNFLNQRYHTNYTYVYSSDVDRALMSAQACLSGLYPPDESQHWKRGLLWQPIPVHTRPLETDFLLRFMDACRRYSELREDLINSPTVLALNAKYAELYDYLSQHAGVPITSIDLVGWLHDTFWIEDTLGLPIPEWARGRLPAYGNHTIYPQLMESISDLGVQLLYHTHQMRRLAGGPLLTDIAAHMQLKVEAALQPAGRQLYMYSGHDTTVAGLLSALGVFNGILPPLDSCVLVELHRDNGAFYVQLLYRNDTTTEPYPLQLPRCEELCPWPMFLELTDDMRPTDAAAECEPPSPPPAA